MSESNLSLNALTKARGMFKTASGWTDNAIDDMPDFVRKSMIVSAKDIINLLSEAQP